MKITEQYLDLKTGERGRREVERPDVISQEEAKKREPALELERQLTDLRQQMQQVLADEALGLDVTERKRELCISALR